VASGVVSASAPVPIIVRIVAIDSDEKVEHDARQLERSSLPIAIPAAIERYAVGGAIDIANFARQAFP